MSDPRPDEFIEFMDALMQSAPEDYDPWLFRCEKGGKNPDLSYGSWKDESARMSIYEAVQWMENGGNIGIAATEDGPLINVDVDDDEETSLSDVKDTLTVRSRSRTGFHAIYFQSEDSEQIPNIPTDDAGEVRARWQYVVAPGSFVPVEDIQALPEDERDDAGYYTVLKSRPPAEVSYNELPQVFIDYDQRDDNADVDKSQMPGGRAEQLEVGDDASDAAIESSESELFNIDAHDVVVKEHGSVNIGDRWEAMFHGSTTGANMSFSDKGLINCWRHNVSHNGLQALAVLSDYDGTCCDVGTGHKNSNAGPSCLKKESGNHIWHAWKYAKKNGYIPQDDPVPYSAMLYVARERDICPATDIPDSKDESLPAYAYDAVIETIENHDGLDAGRSRTDEFGNRGAKSGPTPPESEAADGATDGGVATEQTGAGALSGHRDWSLDPMDVLEIAVQDPLTPHDYDDEDGGYDFYPRDVRNNELASYVWTLAKKSGNDDLLARRHGPLLAYQPDRCIWEADDETRLREIAKQSLGSAHSAGVVNELEAEIRAEPDHVVLPNEMGAPDETIMTRGGLLDLCDRTLEPGKREHRAVANIPHEPDWEADCPRWREFIQESIETEEERKKFQEYCGYTFWRHAQDYGKCMMLVGPTDSGKSTALKVIRHILGADNVASESLQNLVDTRWGRAQLVGNIANIREEVTPSGINGVEMFKELTGGEASVDAEYKGEKKFDFVVTQKFLFATNEVPSVDDADEAFYNRLLFVRFPNTVPPEDQDPDLDDKLKAEAPGILNWMLDGLDRLLEQQAFTAERVTTDKKEICDAFGGVIDRFTHNCLMVTGNSDDIVSKSDLHDLAHAYADDIDKEPDWSKQTGFTRQLSNQRGIGQADRRIDGDVTGCFTGVRVKPEVVYRYDMNLDARCENLNETTDTGLHNYQDSDLRPGYDSRQETNVFALIVKTVRENDGDAGMPHDELVTALTEAGVDESAAEHKIDVALTERGDIYEPESDHYRTT